MRIVFFLVAAIASPMALSAEPVPSVACPPSFVTRWKDDKVAAMEGAMPVRPCVMMTGTGPYICYRDGCVRDQVWHNLKIDD